MTDARALQRDAHSYLIILRDMINTFLRTGVSEAALFNYNGGLCSNYRAVVQSIEGTWIDGVWIRNNDYSPFPWFGVVNDLIRQWPLFSGDINYPVPLDGIDSRDAYYTTRMKYDPDTEYGRNRLALLDYLIEQTKE